MNQPVYPPAPYGAPPPQPMPQPGYPPQGYAPPAYGAPPQGQPMPQPGYPQQGYAPPPHQPAGVPAPYPQQGYAPPPQPAPQGYAPPAYGAPPQAAGGYQAPSYIPQTAASFFEGADAIDADSRTPKVTPGGYRLAVDGCSVSTGHNGTYFIYEMTVLESVGGPEVLPGHATKQPGEKVSWSRKIEGQYRKSGIADAKSACMATMGIHPADKARSAEFGQTFFTQAIAPGSPVIGRTVKASFWYPQTTVDKMRQDPKLSPFIKASWEPDDGRPLAQGAPQPAPQAQPQPQHSAPAPLPAPAQPPAPAAFPPAPWAVHPQDPAWVWNTQTNEVITADALRMRPR